MVNYLFFPFSFCFSCEIYTFKGVLVPPRGFCSLRRTWCTSDPISKSVSLSFTLSFSLSLSCIFSSVPDTDLESVDLEADSLLFMKALTRIPNPEGDQHNGFCSPPADEESCDAATETLGTKPPRDPLALDMSCPVGLHKGALLYPFKTADVKGAGVWTFFLIIIIIILWHSCTYFEMTRILETVHVKSLSLTCVLVTRFCRRRTATISSFLI